MSNTTEKKMTVKAQYEALIEMIDSGCIPDGFTPEGLTEFLQSRIAQIEKKSASSKGGERKPTAKQEANEVLKSAILENMSPDTLYSIGDMVKNFDCFDESTTSQKVNALVKQMLTAGTVERIEDKRKAYFRKVVA